MTTGVVNNPAAIDTNLLITEWERTVNEESRPEDVFEALSGQVTWPGGKKPIRLPDAGYMKLSAGMDDARTVRLVLFKDFYGDPGEGGLVDPRGTEEDILTKTFDMQCNDIFHVHTNEAYGLSAKDKKPWDFIGMGTKLESKYFQELWGRYRRQTVLEGQSANLLEYPHYNAAMLNPHFFIPNVSDSNQPAYNLVLAEYKDNIVNALNHAGVGIDASVSIRFIHRLQEWCFAHLDPFEDSEGQYFVLVLPSPQVTWLKHNTQERALGQYFRSNDNGGKIPSLRFPGYVDRIDKMVIVEDMRYPTISITGAPSASSELSSGTLTCQYRGMGRADDGSSDPRDMTATGRQVGFVLGRKHACEWFPEKLHVEYDYKMYDRIFGSGLFGIFGSKLMCYNSAYTGKSYSLQHDGSCVVVFAKPPVDAYSDSEN
jgi:hypothetical protein